MHIIGIWLMLRFVVCTRPTTLNSSNNYIFNVFVIFQGLLLFKISIILAKMLFSIL